MGAGTPLLEAYDITKRYGATAALNGVSLQVRPGTVHGLMGGNGAGKSTLMKVISAATRPTSGTIVWRGEPVRWSTPADAVRAGISTVHQHIPLAPTLSVLENVFLARRGWRRRDRSLLTQYSEVSERIGYALDPHRPVASLSIGQRQMVAIMQALATHAALIILDEPTASLAVREREHLFAVVTQLVRDDTAFLFCSHLLGEVMAITDHVTVVRDGSVVLTEPTTSLDEGALVRAIAGRALYREEHRSTSLSQPDHSDRAPVLSVTGLRLSPDARPLDLTVMPGDIVGVAGLMGSGRSRLLRTLFADGPLHGGTLRLNGRPYPRSIPEAIGAGVAYVPEDRNTGGVVGHWELWRNMTLPYLPSFSALGLFPRPDHERAYAEQIVDDLGIKTESTDTPVQQLSGGNAQKVSVGRWLRPDVDLLLLDEPTVGVDVGAKADILEAIRRMATDQRAAVLVASSDIEELLAVADRLLIMRSGEVGAAISTKGLDEGDVLALISGQPDLGER